MESPRYVNNHFMLSEGGFPKVSRNRRESMKCKKDRMWIACCGCGRAIHLPETTMLVSSKPIVYKSICPHCGFEHRIPIIRW